GPEHRAAHRIRDTSAIGRAVRSNIPLLSQSRRASSSMSPPELASRKCITNCRGGPWSCEKIAFTTCQTDQTTKSSMGNDLVIRSFRQWVVLQVHRTSHNRHSTFDSFGCRRFFHSSYDRPYSWTILNSTILRNWRAFSPEP